MKARHVIMLTSMARLCGIDGASEQEQTCGDRLDVLRVSWYLANKFRMDKLSRFSPTERLLR